MSGRRRWTVTMTLVCSAAALLASPARAQDRQKAVLTLHATRLNAPATVALDRAIHRALETGLQGNVDYYSEQIDLARFPEPDYPAALRQFLRTKYSQQHFDVIIATSVAMLEFVTAGGNELFPEVPVVFSGSPNSHAGPRSTGIASSLEFKETLDLAVTLQPDVQRVLVVTGVSAWDKFYETLARRAFDGFDGRLTLEYSSGLSMPALLHRVADLPARSLIYFLSLTEDSAGSKFVAVDALDKIAAVANAPIYAWHTVAMNHGIVGGSLLSVERVADELRFSRVAGAGGAGPRLDSSRQSKPERRPVRLAGAQTMGAR